MAWHGPPRTTSDPVQRLCRRLARLFSAKAAADRVRAADDLLTPLADALGRVDRAAPVRDMSRRAAETRGSR
ncbi:hypothetical protein ACFW9L_12975 [Streptomyces sp. NPDC059517]|uniref:hypothetical protein n=1 Tax=Streptomyces sp. NPDC059517 TaxID=3346855 RepID=UPI0036CA97D5